MVTLFAVHIRRISSVNKIDLLPLGISLTKGIGGEPNFLLPEEFCRRPLNWGRLRTDGVGIVRKRSSAGKSLFLSARKGQMADWPIRVGTKGHSVCDSIRSPRNAGPRGN